MKEDAPRHDHVGPVVCRPEAGGTRVEAPVQIGGTTHRLRYLVHGARPRTAPEAFLAPALLPAMASGAAALTVEEAVSPRLLAALPRIQAIHRTWAPALREVAIVADPDPARVAPAPGVGLFFTGGLDSLDSLLVHEDEITTLVYVHGFDVPLEDHARRARIVGSIEETARVFGKRLVQVEADARPFIEAHLPSHGMGAWERGHGAALAGVAHLLGHELGRIYLAASADYAGLVPWGSHPLLDPLFSTERTAIAADGSEAGRLAKTRRVAGNARALASLRVCWQDDAPDVNCGRCDKCLSTMACLAAVGCLDRAPTFRAPQRIAFATDVFITPHVLTWAIADAIDAVAGATPEARRLRKALRGRSLLARLYRRSVRRRARRALRRLLG